MSGAGLPPASPPPHPDGVPERWAPIDGFPGYLVSDQGRVWSVPRVVRAPWGRPRQAGGCFLRHSCGSTGYPVVQLCEGAGNQHHALVHRLVARAFCPRPEGDGLEVHHINHNRSDPRASNLQWVTRRENARAAIEIGRIGGPPPKLSAAAARRIRAASRLGVERRNVAARFGVSSSTVQSVHHGQTWRHAGDPTPADFAAAREMFADELRRGADG